MKKISTTNTDRYIELVTLSNLLSDPDKTGNQKIIKKNIKSRLSIYIEDIQGHEEVIDHKGRITKNICRLHHRNMGQIVVKESYDTITKIKKNIEDTHAKHIGF